MNLRLRPGTVADANECGRIQYEAFKSIAAARQAELPTAPGNVATALMSNGQWWAAKGADGKTNIENYVKAWNSWWLEGK